MKQNHKSGMVEKFPGRGCISILHPTRITELHSFIDFGGVGVLNMTLFSPGQTSPYNSCWCADNFETSIFTVLLETCFENIFY